MTIYDALKQDWILNHKLTEEQFYALSQVHPDERMMRCPNDMFDLPNEVEYRYGSGYVLGDGAWYDPCTEQFFYFETVEESEGVVRFDLGPNYSY